VIPKNIPINKYIIVFINKLKEERNNKMVDEKTANKKANNGNQ
jgi:hypothetical protein